MTGAPASPWPLVPLRRFLSVRRGATPTSDPENWDGPHVWLTPEDLSALDGGRLSRSRRRLTNRGLASCSAVLSPPGSLVVSARAPIGYVVETDCWAATNQGCMALVPTTRLDPRFFRYQLLSSRSELEALGQGATFVELASDSLRSFRVVAPSIEVQQQVADFLDRETARIDAVIARKRRLERLLRERRQSAAGRILLTGGVNRSNAEQGGPSPLEDVTMLSLRQAGVTADTGPFGTQFAASEYAAGGIPMVNPTHIQDGRIEPTEDSTLPLDVAQRLARHAFKLGDIVLGRKGDVGRSALVGRREEGWIAGSDSIILRTTSSRLSPQYLVNLLHLGVIRQQLEASSTGATLANVNESILLAMRVPVPPLSEQQRRASEAQARAAELRRLEGKLEDQLRLLGEHRQALITAAVMGQIDVPLKVASPPDAVTFANKAWRN